MLWHNNQILEQLWKAESSEFSSHGIVKTKTVHSATWAGQHSTAPPNFSFTSSYEFSLIAKAERKHKNVHTTFPLVLRGRGHWQLTTQMACYLTYSTISSTNSRRLKWISAQLQLLCNSMWVSGYETETIMNDIKDSREVGLQDKGKPYKCMLHLLVTVMPCWSQKTPSSDILGPTSATFKDSFGFQVTTQRVRVSSY